MRHFTGNFLLLSVERAILYVMSFKMGENGIIKNKKELNKIINNGKRAKDNRIKR
jgi:hypothetical protein